METLSIMRKIVSKRPNISNNLAVVETLIKVCPKGKETTLEELKKLCTKKDFPNISSVVRNFYHAKF